MPKKSSVFARRAWSLLRLALLWIKKGGALKRGLMVELRHLPSYIKRLLHANNHDSIHYREKQFSFDETPMFHFKMPRPTSMRFHMPSLPCVKPRHVDFDFDFDFDLIGGDEDGVHNQQGRKSFLRGDDDIVEDYDCGGDDGLHNEMVPLEDDEGIDLKAEEFIVKFYEQMKLQRQISYLQYNEMLNRGTC